MNNFICYTGAACVSFILGCLCLHDIWHQNLADTLDMYTHEGVAFFFDKSNQNQSCEFVQRWLTTRITSAQLRHNDFRIFADRSSRNNSENGKTEKRRKLFI